MDRPGEAVCDDRLAALVRLLAGGSFGPVRRFLDSREAAWVAAHHRLPDGTPCPVAPTCDLPPGSGATGARPGDRVRLLAEDGTPIAELAVTGAEPAEGGVRLSGPVTGGAPGGGTVLSGAVAVAPFDTAAGGLAELPGSLQLAVPPHPLDDPGPARRVAEVHNALGGPDPHTLTTPWADRSVASVAHQAIAAISAGAAGLLVPTAAVELVAALRPDVPVRPAPQLDNQDDRAPAAGLTVFFTGLSGSGKSTIARTLARRLGERGRTVTLLDGDAVRTHLSSGLGFDRAGRDANIRRIAYVAAEITKHGGVAICAPIAPYDAARREARAMVERYGSFFLVHVDTPLAVCEERDVKGLYARARAGQLPGFTGVSDPYEPPQDADLRLDTSRLRLAECVDRILQLVRPSRAAPG